MSNTKYDLDHNIYLTRDGEEIKLTLDEVIDIVYAVVDSFGLSYSILDDLYVKYENYKEGN